MEEPRVPFTRRLTFAHLVTIDIVAAVLLAAALTASALVSRHPSLHAGAAPSAAIATAVAIAMAVASAAGVGLRRVRPLTALALALTGEATLVFLGQAADPMIAVALVLYMVAQVKPGRIAAGAMIAVGLVLTVLVVITPVPAGTPGRTRVDQNIGHGASALAVLLAAWAAGRAVRAGRAYAAGLREQADRRAQAKVDQARRAVAEERLQIARELHDVVAHSMSVVAVQAGVGGYVIGQDPAEAASALAAIETTSRAALREMRQLLGILRDGAPGELLAAPGLDDIPDLARRAGLQVDVAVRGTPRPLPAGMELAAFRIVQEALTNVVKHAGTDRGRVVFTYSADAVAIEVTDNGAGGAELDGEGGHGLIGMRERAALYGGEFSAGPLPGRGYRVRVRLPTMEAA